MGFINCYTCNYYYYLDLCEAVEVLRYVTLQYLLLHLSMDAISALAVVVLELFRQF